MQRNGYNFYLSLASCFLNPAANRETTLTTFSTSCQSRHQGAAELSRLSTTVRA